MFSHGPSCGCPFCASWGHLRNYCVDPQRSPRFLEVATLRVRLQYTQLVDLAEGFCPAFELPGQPYVGDPGLPPRTGNPGKEGGEASAPPASAPLEESVRATTPKAKPTPP